jgi:hypothetical protein
MTPAGLRTVFRYQRERAGVPAGHPHALRHTFGTSLAEAGVVRLATKSNVWSLLNFLMFQGHLRPGYDYLVERKLTALWRELTSGPWAVELARFQAAAKALGHGQRTRTGIASTIARSR